MENSKRNSNPLTRPETTAITSIAYEEIYNLYKMETTRFGNESEESTDTANEMDIQETYKVKITSGMYKSTFFIVQEYAAAINVQKLPTLDTPNRKPVQLSLIIKQQTLH